MSTRTTVFAASLLFVARTLAAQEDSEEWLSQCRHDWNDRPKVCVVRETGFHPAGGTLTIDPSENGGVAVYGWDRDSIGVVAKIEAQANSESAAQAIADGVHIEAG